MQFYTVYGYIFHESTIVEIVDANVKFSCKKLGKAMTERLHWAITLLGYAGQTRCFLSVVMFGGLIFISIISLSSSGLYPYTSVSMVFSI